MKKLLLGFIFIFSILSAWSQQDVLIFKKKNKSIEKFWKGSVISFQVNSKQWRKGEITRINKDSFYIRPSMVIYSLYGTDTVRFPIQGYTIADIHAMPNKGILVNYKNGSYQIQRSAGHVHFYWIKSGAIFRIGAAAYAGVNIANGLINNDLSFKKSKEELGIAAAVFLAGLLLHKTYKPALRIGKKYKVEGLVLSNKVSDK
jgi:hypothetical protein